MTTHELANYLLNNTEDVPVYINGWGSSEGRMYEVTKIMYDENKLLFGYDNPDNWLREDYE